MKVLKVTDDAFRKYGRIVDNVEFAPLLNAMKATPVPEGVAYEPSVKELEETATYDELKTKTFGELPIQIGYCNGHNELLNAVEYHRNSEINVAATKAILMLGMQQDITSDYKYETSKMEAFLVPEGIAVELYATTLHYAPCGVENEAFKVAVVLPKGTNCPLQDAHQEKEDALITAQNKWLIGHAEGGLDANCHIGLIGENLNINK